MLRFVLNSILRYSFPLKQHAYYRRNGGLVREHLVFQGNLLVGEICLAKYLYRWDSKPLIRCERHLSDVSLPVTDFGHQSSFPSLERKDATAINLVSSFNVCFLGRIDSNTLSSTSSLKIGILESTFLIFAPSSRWYTPLCLIFLLFVDRQHRTANF